MISTADIKTVTDGNVHSHDGGKIGSVGQVYLDNDTGQPAWVTVKTGMFGNKASFVPLADATVDGNDVRVPYDKDMVTGAPNVEADGELTPAEEEELYRYYGVEPGGTGTSKDRTDAGEQHESAGRTAAGTAAAGGRAGNETEHRGEHRDESQRERSDESQRERSEEHAEHRPEEPQHTPKPPHTPESQRAPKPEHDSENERAQGGREEAGEQQAGGRRIRRYIVTEETITRREEI